MAHAIKGVNFIKDMYNFCMKKKYILFLTVICFMCLGLERTAYSQEVFPEFSFSALSEETSQPSPTSELQSDIVIKKPLMRDILILQNQNNLLKGLIERQASIKQISENYKNLGLPFVQPAPTKSVCEKLPANLLCLNFYPEMPQNAAIIDNFQPSTPPLDFQNQLDALNNIDLGNNDTPLTLNDTTAQTQPARQYNWTDIQCLGNYCTALVTSDNNFRMRVSEGDLLPDDARVSSISFSKVTIKDGDNSADIKPLSLSNTVGQNSSPEADSVPRISQPQNTNRPQSSGIRQLLDNNLANNTPTTTPTMSDGDSFAGQESSTGGTLMSPTGLF